MPTKDQEKAGLYRNGRMTRAGMVKVIEGGGSVMHEGVVYSKVDDLPDDATLNEGDEEGARQAQSAIDAQIAALGAQRAALDATAARAKESARAKPQADEENASSAKEAAEKQPKK
jgi:hypothetical protein